MSNQPKIGLADPAFASKVRSLETQYGNSKRQLIGHLRVIYDLFRRDFEATRVERDKLTAEQQNTYSLKDQVKKIEAFTDRELKLHASFHKKIVDFTLPALKQSMAPGTGIIADPSKRKDMKAITDRMDAEIVGFIGDLRNLNSDVLALKKDIDANSILLNAEFESCTKTNTDLSNMIRDVAYSARILTKNAPAAGASPSSGSPTYLSEHDLREDNLQLLRSKLMTLADLLEQETKHWKEMANFSNLAAKHAQLRKDIDLKLNAIEPKLIAIKARRQRIKDDVAASLKIAKVFGSEKRI